LKKNQIDLVYTNTTTLISPSIAAKFVGIPSLFHIHEIPNGNFIYANFITIFLNTFSVNIICVSKAVSDFWIKMGLKKDKLSTISNGFIYKKINKKSLDKKKIIFTCVSRIIPYKGHELLIKLFEILCKKNSKIYLQIVGDTLPQYEKYMRRLKLNIKSRGLDDRITFMGYRKDVIQILTKSNFFIHLPTSPDPLPTVIFEAIKTKTPVITNNLGGAIEILNNGNNGLIIENNLIDKSADKILNFIKNKKCQKDNVDNAYDYVCKNYSFDKFKKKILNIIE
jgi:glycosyltransferase involved in cell wall biosynthesis